MARLTFVTSGNKKIDIVDTEKEVQNDWYILLKDCKQFVQRVKELTSGKVTSLVAKILIQEGLLREKPWL